MSWLDKFRKSSVEAASSDEGRSSSGARVSGLPMFRADGKHDVPKGFEKLVKDSRAKKNNMVAPRASIDKEGNLVIELPAEMFQPQRKGLPGF